MKSQDSIQNKLETASPLQMARVLEEIELRDKKEAQQVIDEIYKEFKSGKDIEDSILWPVGFRIVDGILEGTKTGRFFRKKGITASRVVEECKRFNYHDSLKRSELSAYDEYKNIRDETGYDADRTTRHPREQNEKIKNFIPNIEKEETSSGIEGSTKYTNKDIKEYKGNRTFFDDVKKRNKYKEINISDGYIIDEYSGNKIRKDETATDHIIPLARVHEQFKNNMAITAADIKEIANQEGNYALISSSFNCAKKEKLNEEMTKYKENPIGKPVRDKMQKLSEEAQESVNQTANKTVLKNLAAQESVRANVSKAAINQIIDIFLGDIALFIIKPLFYEMKDILTYGIEQGVKIKGKIKAIKYRIKRFGNYVLECIVHMIEDMEISKIKDFLINMFKEIVSNICEVIINCFVGFFKSIVKIMKEGIKVFCKSYEVCFGKNSAKMSSKEKGDAIVKIIGSSILALAGIGIENMLRYYPIPGEVIWATIISGILSVIFMYCLDKMDLFNVKADVRKKRIEEIFAARKKDLDTAITAMDSTAIGVLSQQAKAFDELSTSINSALSKDSFQEVNEKVYALADFLKIELPYNNTVEFIHAYDNSESISLS